MKFPIFSKSEQKAILSVAAEIAFNDGWKDNDKRLLSAISHRFSFSNQEVVSAMAMEPKQAILTVKSMDAHKKNLASCLFQSAAMSDGNMSLGKPQWERYFEYAEECSLPMNIPFAEALNVSHQYLGC